MGAIAIGAASGLVCFIFSTAIKSKFGYDDSLDVFGVHGIGGFLGIVMVGVFGHESTGGFDQFDIGTQVVTQLKAACITAVYAIVASIVILLLIKFTIGLRINETQETEGIDMAEHAERGYNL